MIERLGAGRDAGALADAGFALDILTNAGPRLHRRRSRLLRQLDRVGRDPLLDEITLVLPERLGLRRIELCRLRTSDVNLHQATVEVWGKGDKDRLTPIPSRLVKLLDTYLEDRRPAHVPRADWLRSDETLLRRGPAGTADMGRAAGRDATTPVRSP